jgi:hypothetical protein
MKTTLLEEKPKFASRFQHSDRKIGAKYAKAIPSAVASFFLSNRGETHEILIDAEDIEKVRDVSWVVRDGTRVGSVTHGTLIAVVTGSRKKHIHKNGDWRDYRKDNLIRPIPKRGTCRFVEQRMVRLSELRDGKLCKRCGNPPGEGEVLHFHHRDPSTKSFNVAAGARGRVWADVLAEVEKCDLLCRSCHSITHAEMNRSPQEVL